MCVGWGGVGVCVWGGGRGEDDRPRQACAGSDVASGGSPHAGTQGGGLHPSLLCLTATALPSLPGMCSCIASAGPLNATLFLAGTCLHSNNIGLNST